MTIKIVLNDLPYNKNGNLTRSAIIKTLGEPVKSWASEGRKFITSFCGGRDGNSALFTEEAHIVADLTSKNGFVAINGGCTEGVMGATTKNCERIICYVPTLFAQCTGAGTNEGLVPGAVNVVVPDFFERKPCMTMTAHGEIILPGGFGTAEESLEGMVFALQSQRKMHFVSIDGFWESMHTQLKQFIKLGLMPQEYVNAFTISPNAESAFKKCMREISERQLEGKIFGGLSASLSLRDYLERHPDVLPKAIVDFLHDGQATSHHVPRIGVIASGNIGRRSGRFNIENEKLRGELIENCKMLGRNLALEDAALVISGSKSGLRGAIADAAIQAGGKVIWIQAEYTGQALRIEKEEGQRKELYLKVSQQYEVDRLMGYLCHNFIGVAGGLHTADRMLGIVTRIQTGHSGYSDLHPEFYAKDHRRPRVIFYDPQINGTTLWGPLTEQIKHCSDSGFIPATPEKNHLALFHPSHDTGEMTALALKEGSDQHDLVMDVYFSRKPRSTDCSPRLNATGCDLS